MKRMAIVAVLAFFAGAVIAAAIAILAGLRVLPAGTMTSQVRFDLDGAHEFGSGWLMTSDTNSFATTVRARALVAPASYGTVGPHIDLDLLQREDDITVRYLPREDPVLMAPGTGVEALSPEKREAARSGNLLSPGTILAWPLEWRLGWPCACLAYSVDGVYGWAPSGYFATKALEVVGGHQVDFGFRATPLDARVIPFTPIWSGLLINTLIYGVLVAFLWSGAREGRRWNRRRRGRCTDCGHLLDALTTCPECGSQKQRRPALA